MEVEGVIWGRKLLKIKRQISESEFKSFREGMIGGFLILECDGDEENQVKDGIGFQLDQFFEDFF